mmetsp:Transcript_18496/g.27367  ORF Transcript_18496/g.27367 Transcript_18496/m.27367 type:complete len:213 (+) Transcript_18496:90-728(+)
MTTTVVVTALHRPPRSRKKRRPQKHVPVQKRGEMNVDNSNKRGLPQRPPQRHHHRRHHRYFHHRHQYQPLQLLHFQLGKSLRKRQQQHRLQPRQRDDELPSNEQPPLLLPVALAKVQAKRPNQQRLHRNSNRQKRVDVISLPTFNSMRLQWWTNRNRQLTKTMQPTQPPKTQEMKNSYPSAIKRRSNKRARHVLKNYVKNDSRVDIRSLRQM